jgi:serine/threonine protein kinase
MEYAPAGDLAGFIRAAAASKLSLPEATIWQIVLQLCQGLHVCAQHACSFYVCHATCYWCGRVTRHASSPNCHVTVPIHQAIHETAVVHRDLKPANIFCCPGNVVKLGDLGVAKALTRGGYAQTIIGTPLYMAPEVCDLLEPDKGRCITVAVLNSTATQHRPPSLCSTNTQH